MSFKRNYSKTISVDVDIELSIIDDDDLLEELNRRKLSHFINKMDMPDFKTKEDHLDYIKVMLGLKNYHSKERVLQEITELLS